MENKNLSSYYSRIKSVFIELHQYSYFHSHSDSNLQDRRFIGRKAIVEKLKSLFTESETKSGAYLITGYRGMGKTSVVNSVIDNLVETSMGFPPVSRILRILIVLLLLCLINESKLWIWFVIGMAGLVSSYYLYKWSPRRNNLKISQRPDSFIAQFGFLFPQIFNLREGANRLITSRTILQDIVILVILYTTVCLHFLFKYKAPWRWGEKEILFSDDYILFYDKFAFSIALFLGVIVAEYLVNIWLNAIA